MARECKHCGGEISRRFGPKYKAERIFCSKVCVDGDRAATRAERFWECVDIGPRETCWPWRKGVSRDGYGKVRFYSRSARAHRVAYSLFYGEISEELLVLHSCDNPICCNPHHLRQGDIRDNARDRVERGRNPERKGSKNTMAILTEETVAAILRDERPQVAIAASFGVSKVTVCQIKKRRIWKHVSA